MIGQFLTTYNFQLYQARIRLEIEIEIELEFNNQRGKKTSLRFSELCFVMGQRLSTINHKS